MRVACRFCKQTCPSTDEMGRSAWTHSHPGVCPARHDRMPSINGVHVGDHWINVHTRGIARIVEARAGGLGVYVDREPAFALVNVWSPGDPVGRAVQPMLFSFGGKVEIPSLAFLEALQPEPDLFVMGTPMWALVEHYDPITRPGEYPVPWKSDRRERIRWTEEAWRCPGIRYADGTVPDYCNDSLYFHAFHIADRGFTSLRWEWWQVNADTGKPVFQLDQVPAREAVQLTLPIAA